jgi:pimeloyl-ACP methyl ester carboxylesterase
MDNYRSGNLVFDVIDEGPADGPVVVLLHGFPQFNTSWSKVIPRLTAQGYRCLAPNQRGYSRGARPTRRRDYRIPKLVEDVLTLIDASGASKVHLVGHDWGALVAWAVAAEYPDRLGTVSPISVPHPAAFLRALVSSRQALASWYMYVFQLPQIPERFLLGRHGRAAQLSKALRSAGQSAEAADRDARAMTEPGVLTAALNWYRAIPLSDLRDTRRKISVPTLYVWSDQDTALVGKPAQNTGHYVSGEYRFETLHGVSHWILDEKPDVLADLLLEWFAAHPS